MVVMGGCCGGYSLGAYELYERRYVSEANGFLAHPMSPASSEVLGSHANSPPPSVKDADCTMLTDMDPGERESSLGDSKSMYV